MLDRWRRAWQVCVRNSTVNHTPTMDVYYTDVHAPTHLPNVRCGLCVLRYVTFSLLSSKIFHRTQYHSVFKSMYVYWSIRHALASFNPIQLSTIGLLY